MKKFICTIFILLVLMGCKDTEPKEDEQPVEDQEYTNVDPPGGCADDSTADICPH